MSYSCVVFQFLCQNRKAIPDLALSTAIADAKPFELFLNAISHRLNAKYLRVLLANNCILQCELQLFTIKNNINVTTTKAPSKRPSSTSTRILKHYAKQAPKLQTALNSLISKTRVLDAMKVFLSANTYYKSEKIMDNNKIWLLLDSRQSGGIESHVLQLAQGLKCHGQSIEVLFLTHYGEHPMHNALQQQGIKYRILDGSFNTLRKLLKTEHPMVLHTHGYKSGIFGRLAARVTNIATISTYHAGEIATGKLALYDWLDRVSAGFAQKVFAVSPQIAKRLPSKTEVFNNFVNEHGLTRSIGQQIAFVGRISDEKGPDYFMALAIHFPQIHFHLYGDGPLLSDLQNSAPANLHIHGQQEDMSKVWPQIGLLVMPSRYEGLPMAALEAMARGIPVLAFNVGALEHLISTQANGWLVEPGNIKTLANHIAQWQSFSTKQKSSMSIACQKTINTRFSSKIAIPQLIATYQSFRT